MKQLNWLKKKDIDNGLYEVFIKPDFFDFSETKYPEGIPILGGSLSLEDLNKLFEKAECYFQDSINSLTESCAEDNEVPLDRLLIDWEKYKEAFFVKNYGDADFKLMKSFFHPRVVLPYVNHDDHIFSHGIAINNERNYSRDGAYDKYEYLNSLIFEITKKHLSLI